MEARRKILYVQHAASLGGSVISLREVVLDAVASGLSCTVLCPNENVANIYKAVGAAVEITPIATFDHNSAFHYRTTPIDVYRVLRLMVRTFRTRRALKKIASRIRPDVVHLNSSTLILYARLFRKLDLPVVLHIRESIVQGYLGLRKKRIRQIANRDAAHIIYISEYEYMLLKTSPSKSSVIYNYVHEEKFLSTAKAPIKLERSSGLRFVTLGGLAKLKGADIILKALALLPKGELVILGADDPRNDTDKLARQEGAAYAKEIVSLLQSSALVNRVRFAGSVEEPASWIACADALIFWAARPHFPRPVFEAWLLGKSVIYYNPLFESARISTSNAVIVTDSHVNSLAEAMNAVSSSYISSEAVKEATIKIAQECFTEHNFVEVQRVYDTVLNQR